MIAPPLEVDPRVAERASRLSDRRCPDARGHYELLLPRELRPVDRPFVLPSDEDSPAQCALFQSLEPPQIEIEITGLFLRREIAPADVLGHLLGDHEVVQRRRVPSPGGDQLDALTRAVGREPYVSRWWTVKDGGAGGGRLFVLEGRAPAAHYDAWAASLATSLASFRLLEPTPWDYFEKLRSFARRAPNDLVCFYPASWQLRVRRDEEDGVVADLWQVLGGQLLGRITLLSDDAESAPEDACDRYAEALGAEVRWADPEEAEPFGRLERAWSRRGRAAAGDAVLDVTSFVGRRSGGTVTLALASLSSVVDPLAAASTRRALDIVRDTLRVA